MVQKLRVEISWCTSQSTWSEVVRLLCNLGGYVFTVISWESTQTALKTHIALKEGPAYTHVKICFQQHSNGFSHYFKSRIVLELHTKKI